MGVFDDIYAKSLWGVGSGGGSDPDALGPYLAYLQNMLRTVNIRSILDLGCGDWRYVRTLDLCGADYVGIDCVRSVVDENTRKYSGDRVRFVFGDLLDMDFPPADLLICKDVLQHLPTEGVLRILPKLEKFPCCLLTNDWGSNVRDIGDTSNPYAGLDLQSEPFSLQAEVVCDMQVCCVTKRVLCIRH